jgi:hypothetical protein
LPLAAIVESHEIRRTLESKTNVVVVFLVNECFITIFECICWHCDVNFGRIFDILSLGFCDDDDSLVINLLSVIEF